MAIGGWKKKKEKFTLQTSKEGQRSMVGDLTSHGGRARWRPGLETRENRVAASWIPKRYYSHTCYAICWTLIRVLFVSTGVNTPILSQPINRFTVDVFFLSFRPTIRIIPNWIRIRDIRDLRGNLNWSKNLFLVHQSFRVDLGRHLDVE